MSSESRFFILTFHSVHAAIRAERELAGRGQAPKLIPVPREIASDCGFCLLLIPGAGLPSSTDENSESLRELARGLESESIWLVTEHESPGRALKEKSYERQA